MISSIFIVSDGSNWILKFLADDIYENIKRQGIQVRIGDIKEYRDEEVCFHMWWRTAVPAKDAKKNVVFVTHIDDKGKEYDLLQLKNQFDIFICMSEEDAKFLEELGFNKNSVFGLNLPVRNKYIKPMTLAIFSNCYSDNRKNEKWIIDFCKSNTDCNLLNFLLIGHGWESVGIQLNSLGSSFVWYSISREMPSEYFYQQLSLLQADYYLYMGMDGGAMGSYDAYALGLRLCISDDGYHKAIPDVEMTFNTQEEFEECLYKILEKQKLKIQFFNNQSPDNYVKRLIYVIENQVYPTGLGEKKFKYSVKEKRRNNYFRMTLHRLKQPIITKYLKYKRNSI